MLQIQLWFNLDINLGASLASISIKLCLPRYVFHTTEYKYVTTQHQIQLT